MPSVSVLAPLLAVSVSVMSPLLCLAQDPPIAVVGPRRVLLGTNLSGVGPITTGWDLADLMKGSNNWNSGAVGSSTYNAYNWPTSIPAGQSLGTNIRLNVSNRLPDYPLGSYTVTWEGQGQFFMSGGGGFLFQNANGTGSAAFNVTTSGEQIYFQINSTNAANPVRNIKLLMPGHGPGQANAAEQFNTTFLDRFKPFGTIRFMDWGSTNSNSLVSWADRPLPSNRTFATSKGLPVETMVAAANRQKANGWFNVPVKADDNYVRQMATLVRDTMDPARVVYVEYGNECWNPQFTVERGHLDSLGQSRYGSTSFWYRAWADEAKRVFTIWKDVFNQAGQGDRLVRVAAAQSVNRFHSPRFFNRLYSNGTDTTFAGERFFDAISMAAYLGVNSSSYGTATTKDKIIDDLYADLARQMDPTIGSDGLPRGDFRWHKLMAQQYGVPLIAYEGGQHVVPPNTTVAWYDDYVAAQRDTRMYDLYRELMRQYFEVLRADGFMAFSSVSEINEFGAWGMLEKGRQDPATAPKYRAYVDYINSVAVVPEPGPAMAVAGPAVLLLGRRRRVSEDAA